jgi:glycosyltransferase involved in cell wall biosynthesis
MKVTVLALTLNERDGVKAILPRIPRDQVDQLLVVDGGSTDGTIEWVRDNGYAIYVQQRRGIRYAYLEALPMIVGDVIVSLSPDGNCNPAVIPALIAEMRRGYDLVIGSRYVNGAKSEDDDLLTAFGNRLFTRTVNLLYGAHYSDVMVIYRAFTRSLIYELGLDREDSYTLPERLFRTIISWEPLMSIRAAKQGKRVGEVAAGEPQRIGGKRKLQLFRWGAAYYFQIWKELFGLMSAEKAVFGPRYRYWQLAGILIHCAIVGVLLRLLLRLGRSYPAASVGESRLHEVLAYVMALFFAVNFANTEMVIWCHIQGYMIYVLCVLGGLRLLVDELCGFSEGTFWRRAAAFVLLVIAAFAYEVGSVFAVSVGFVLGLSAARRGHVRRGSLRFVLFASILPLFMVTERLDRLVHPEARQDITENSVLKHAEWKPTLEHAGRYLLFTLGQPFFPAGAAWGFEDRIVLPEPGQNPQAFWRNDSSLFVSYGVIIAGIALSLPPPWRVLRHSHARQSSVFLLIPVSLILLHTAIIVLGRMNMRPVAGILAFNSYYAYTPLLAFLVGLYFLWVTPKSYFGFRISDFGFRIFFIAGLAVLSLVGAGKIREMNQHIRAYYRPLRTEMAAMQSLIDEDGYEPGFAISFDPDTYYTLRDYHGLPRVHILYARYIDHETPSHIICREGTSLVTMREEDYHREYGRRYRCLPKFIEPAGNGFMIFRHQDSCYGLHFDEGCFRTDRKDYRCLLQGNSVADVTGHIPSRGEAKRNSSRSASRTE